MLANMVCSLIEEERITTTVTKAKETRRLAEKMVTLGKRADLHARRRAIAALRQPSVVRILFDEIAPRYASRLGGYTRIVRLGVRRGDAAEMCFLEFVEGRPEGGEAEVEVGEGAADEEAEEGA